ncbi:MAG: Gfo/Idh/MocA family protein [Bacteroidales bacterium]
MENNKYNIGIIGAGMIAEKHINSFSKTGRVNLKWVARQDASKLKEFQEKFNIPNGTKDYREILKDETVNAVVITAPPKFHYQMFLDSLAAGKHVLLEKPSAINPGDLQDMIRFRKKYPELKVCDCSCRHSRLQPKFRFVKELILSGKLGDIYYIHHNSVTMQGRPGIEYHPAAKWFLDKSIAGGGPLLDWGVYDLSFHLGLLDDKPELKSANQLFMKAGLDKKDPGTPVYDIEEHFGVNMEFSDGLKYYWERAAHANMDVPNETRIYGTKGGIKLSFCTWDSNKVEFFFVNQEGKGKPVKEVAEIDVASQDDDLELARHFIEVLDGKAEPAMPLELAAKHLEIIMKIYDL